MWVSGFRGANEPVANEQVNDARFGRVDVGGVHIIGDGLAANANLQNLYQILTVR